MEIKSIPRLELIQVAEAVSREKSIENAIIVASKSDCCAFKGYFRINGNKH